MRCLPVLILFCLCVTHAGAAVRIAEFCPDPYLHDDADEYIVLSGIGALDGITVSNGNGGFRFPAAQKSMGARRLPVAGRRSNKVMAGPRILNGWTLPRIFRT